MAVTVFRKFQSASPYRCLGVSARWVREPLEQNTQAHYDIDPKRKLGTVYSSGQWQGSTDGYCLPMRTSALPAPSLLHFQVIEIRDYRSGTPRSVDSKIFVVMTAQRI
ncbi:hypothetical protein BaRGS_00000787 [Batillaria attramentaria]|uniref:Uncharacterized protein n=1 Tax=Batillaria attramentaria TaxID=370345 RepID=A0ABD0M8W9_9CAEN